ncbi:tetratricopeptide repeat protein [Sphaerospermopsis torques-reginae]|jgi:tetratricopeptide (TPR) repeat protein|uniref:Tetratricopeptide repeat protein n=1 Tax=Sphaerospermopsis torques-reginae ITEP-024 TaxID=984208 RepID=A0ABX8WVE0_9CYAN|nr:tetratricopeptide repeat protein [Sphaerospermopsis torques-reginae]QYX30372.1 tetratricopeptide repeat protein [Sphaerospermopsis torques-reginae ITEP-024]
MSTLKLPVTCLSLTISSLIIFGGNFSQAEASPTQAIQISNNWLLEGKIKVNQQDYQGAILDFTQAINRNQQNAEAYYQRGLIYARYAQGKPLNPDGTVPGCRKKDDYIIICPVEVKDKIQEYKQKAIADFTQAITINPQYAVAYHQRGLIQEENEQKIADFQIANTLYLQKSLASLKAKKFSELTQLLKIIDKLQSEINSLNRIVDLRDPELQYPVNSSTVSPDSIEELNNQAYAALNKGDVQTAIQKFKTLAIKLQENKEYKRYQQIQLIIIELEKIRS